MLISFCLLSPPPGHTVSSFPLGDLRFADAISTEFCSGVFLLEQLEAQRLKTGVEVAEVEFQAVSGWGPCNHCAQCAPGLMLESGEYQGTGED